MDKALNNDNDFWYRDLPFTNIEVHGYRQFTEKLMSGLGESMIKNNFSIDLEKDNPLNYWDRYSIFDFQNDQMYDLLQHIKSLMSKACNALNIDYEKQKYHIHGWIDVYNGEFNDTNVNNLNWYDETTKENVFSGMFMFDAEDSFNYYMKDGDILEIENIPGRLCLFTNYQWFHGKWTENRSKIVFGFNIYPISLLPEVKDYIVKYIPL